ncbi:hypothetical protein [Streptomyces rugosispiralis]|uniref:Uncharacterized protein n=1 Tax=Streptomyces rugosispiralis TaxID=2967341 RepID=A0ABT1V3A2_9ACTN|nr:hypothetical protein [Streptomyces rugosispiralis]MCQ8191041.1 hypothetical protein [Streptomyces rugosispiralis]
MTMRVYTMARDGIVIARRAVVTVLTGRDSTDAYGLGQAWPPCQCPRHREQNATGSRGRR